MADEPGPNGSGERSQREDLILELESVRELYGGLAPSLSTDGIFIAIEDPPETDSKVTFQVTLPGGALVLEGTGTVAWTRPAADDRGPAGMAVRFAELSASARETIDAVIDAHLAAGGQLFDLETDPEAADVYPTDALEGAPQSLGCQRWKWRLGTVDDTRAAANERAQALFRTEREADAIDLRFEEILHGLSPVPKSAGSRRPSELDEAITKAVSAASSSPESDQPTADKGSSGADDREGARSSTGEAEIPEILDHWKKEVDTGVHDLARMAGRRESDQLSFDDDWGQELATRPVAPEDVSSGRRRAAERERPWLWWAVGAAAVALLAATLILLWPGGGPPSALTSPSPAAPRPSPAPQPEPEPGMAAAAAGLDSSPLQPEDQPSASAGRRVQDLTTRQRSGSTEVVVRADGPIDPQGVDTLRLDDPPRILLRIRGIEEPYTPHRVDVGSLDVAAIRIGHHPELQPPTLYVVLDTTSPEVEVVSSGVSGSSVTVVVARSGS